MWRSRTTTCAWQALADVATIALLQERTIAHADILTEQLQGALNSRVVIEQAKGALAQIEGTTPADAFELMRSQARSSRRRLVDVAMKVLDQTDHRSSRCTPAARWPELRAVRLLAEQP